MGSETGGDAVVGRAVAEILADSHLMPPSSLAEVLARRARPLGVRGVRIYLADLQQRSLRSMPAAGSVSAEDPSDVLTIEATLAGRAFQTYTVHHTDVDGGELFRVWAPLVDGTERLGILELTVDDVGERMLAHCRTLASLAGLIIVSKSAYSDAYPGVRRSRDVTLPAEMVWAFMAPTTFATERATISAVLEPAYEVGGDAFDFSMLGDHLHVSIFDAVGHDLAAGLITSVAMASCRNTRRAGGDLVATVVNADDAIAGQFGDSRFATALLCDLNTVTGEFTWITCGHPPPLLIRDKKVVKELLREPSLPLGIRDHDIIDGGKPQTPVHTEQLEPGDRLLIYTDGVVEGRTADGHEFGIERLGDFVIRHSATDMPAAETLRRLNHAVSDYQQGRLSDDATTLLLEWTPPPTP